MPSSDVPSNKSITIATATAKSKHKHIRLLDILTFTDSPSPCQNIEHRVTQAFTYYEDCERMTNNFPKELCDKFYTSCYWYFVKTLLFIYNLMN